MIFKLIDICEDFLSYMDGYDGPKIRDPEYTLFGVISLFIVTFFIFVFFSWWAIPLTYLYNLFKKISQRESLYTFKRD